VPGSPPLESYLAVLGGGGGDLTGARLVQGQFHDVVLAADAAYRFPRDERSRAALPARAALLAALAQHPLPVTVPGLLSQAALDEPLGRCHIVLRRVPGHPIGPGEVAGPRQREAAVAGLAGLLDRLGALGGDPDVQAAAPPACGRAWERFAGEVARVLFPLIPAGGRERAQAELVRVMTVDPAGTALVHGDLGGTNLLWRAAGGAPRLAGVLDWDEAHLGNPAEDLASIAATFGWPLARTLDARRHGGETPTIADAGAIAATFALQQALPAALSGDAGNLADGLAGYLG
jgi:aminoglycoside phosphotransferase (APT) family kinase protein